MTIQTRCTDRRSMAAQISEQLGTPAVYMRMPSCAYRIGAITVNRDGSITGEADDLSRILPVLQSNGFVAADTESSAMVFSLEGWSAPNVINLIKLLYRKQDLINRMLRSDDLHIDADLIGRLTASPPEGYEELEARLRTGGMKGVSISKRSITFSHGAAGEAAKVLFERILEHARTARRVNLSTRTSGSEKYEARAFLMQLGLGGSLHKEVRTTLLRHLPGYAAFRSEADMQAHRERQKARRQNEE